MPRTRTPEKFTQQLIFGTAGVPISAAQRSSEAGVVRSHELGLGCMEVEFVHGVRMSSKSAAVLGDLAKRLHITLTAHAPYYINLNAREPEKIEASRERILQTARITSDLQGEGIVIHAAFYLKDRPEDVYERVKRHLSEIVEQLDKENSRVWIRPEVTGKESQFGTLNELLRLSAEIEGVAPCIDFAHLHARYGRINSYKEFSQVLDQVGDKLGDSALSNLHIHLSGIDYGDKGERKHLNLSETDYRYAELLQALKDHQAKGILICESPNLEEDALLLQQTYQTI